MTTSGENPEPLDTPAPGVNNADNSTDASLTETTISAGTTEAGQDMHALLGVNALVNPEHQRTIFAALTFVDSPGQKRETDIADVATSVGNVIGDYAQEGLEPPEIVNAIHSRVELLSRQMYIAAAGEELAKDEPDLMVLLRCMRMASMNAATLPVEIQEDIELLRQEIEMRNVESPTYNRMCELSMVVGEVFAHLSSAKTIATAKILRGSLTSGALPESIKTAASLLPKLRSDAGKNGQESQAALQEVANRIEQLANQLKETE